MQERKRPHGPQEYKGNGAHGWETVNADGPTERLRVPGGWLYRDGGGAGTMCFVPLPETVGYVL